MVEVLYSGMGKQCVIKVCFNREFDNWDPIGENKDV